MKTIRTRLLLGLMTGTLGCTLAAGMLLYMLADHEADEQSDQRLRQLAWSLPLQAPVPWRLPHESDPDDQFDVQAWNAEQQPVHVSQRAPALPLPQPQGYVTVGYHGERWRVYADVVAGYHLQVSQPIAIRQRVAAHMALRIVPPLLLLLPAMAILIWVVVGRALQPLERLTKALRGRTPAALQPLDDDGLAPELLLIVAALNGLLRKVADAITTQRNFVADAAHELRSPLTALKLQLQLAERAADDASRQTSFRKLHERLDRATHLVQQLMTLARQEQSAVPPTCTDCDLLKIAGQVVADHTIYADSRRIDLGVSADAQSVRVCAQMDGLAIMLSNLVDNALRYTPLGGQVDVMVGQQQGRAYLRVCDNGPGVPEAGRERLFDRFYRPDGNEVWGSGLGLSIVKSVADAHQATLSLHNGSGDRGLVVTVLFPQAAVIA
ncbi:two-component sensor histidine kinase [Duganella dendranthematis]|uniref:histidine kinase n=1 Tax=Duganella dendranthematis TaxID=2728021 RepID=A0ABX6MHM1_9BURK|nr:ATP-binding protein [Duganella dendranthematis]QJD93424.1 two-component sensor histidine kinase [Duganella dendranthematis]